MSETKDLQALMDRNRRFAQRVFPEHCDDPIPPLHHLFEEVKETIGELEADYIDREKLLFEYADCLILLVGSAVRIGITAEQLLDYSNRKMTINEKRDWGKPDKNGVYLHKKDSESKPCPNCKETASECACVRNKCAVCGGPVGNVTFTVCDDCWTTPDSTKS